MQVISLGAGVQSSTLALMAAHGEITPMPDVAIFADTQWEPKTGGPFGTGVYGWLDWLEAQLPFPVLRVSAGNIRDDALADKRSASLPYFTGNKTGLTMRQCTAEYKIAPIQKKLRELIGLKPRQRAPREPVITQWIGISLDEVQRIKPSRVPWVEHRWPLIDARMTRQDCLNWMALRAMPRPPRSSCIGCPYHSDNEWREMRNERLDEWADAVDFDRQIRSRSAMKQDVYLHRSCMPLDQVDLRTAADHGQVDLFGNECSGICGV